MSNASLPLSNKTLQTLGLKHPEGQQVCYEAILKGPKRQMHSIVYEDIDGDLVKTSSIKLKEEYGQCGVNVDN